MLGDFYCTVAITSLLEVRSNREVQVIEYSTNLHDSTKILYRSAAFYDSSPLPSPISTSSSLLIGSSGGPSVGISTTLPGAIVGAYSIS